MKTDYEFKCCLCGRQIKGEWGNNPYPAKTAGECCDKCNELIVIPARIRHFNYLKTLKK